MKRGRAIVVGVLVLVGALVMPQADRGEPSAAGRASRPNIVVIETDDQTLESLRVMANVRRLIADQGATFENSVVSFALCCPSRATLLTGQYAQNHGVQDNGPPSGGYDRLDHTNTLAVWLQRAGYATVLVGKYLNGYGRRSRAVVPPGWSEWHGGVRLAYLGHTLSENGRLVSYGEGSYQTDVYARLAVEAIRRRARSEQPFFLWLTPFAPHVGGPADPDDPPSLKTPSPAPRHRDLFAFEPLPPALSLNEEDVSDKPAGIQRRPLLDAVQLAAIREAYQQRLESLLAVDEAVAAVVAELKRSKALERTVIFFTSDNGFFHGEHRITNWKVLPYEPAIRVPLLVRGPGVPPGLHLQQLVANVDLAPTIVELAGAQPRRRMDGQSLLPLLRDPGLEWGRDILIEGPPRAASLGARAFTGLRTPRFAYTEYADGSRELYDLGSDPDELQSLHADPAYDPLEAELARRLAELRTCSGSACRKGPALELAVSCEGGARARIAGLDERLLDYVDFLVNGRGVGRDEDTPFEQVLPPEAVAGSKLRALAVLLDGRRVTIDLAVPACQ